MFEKGFKLEMNNVDFLPTKNVTLQLLDEYNQSIKKKRSLDSIIYGKNGSGKSTICKAINSYLLGINRYETKLLTSCDEEYDETSTKNIKIYSEFFIDNNVKFKSIGLDTIILLGESVEVDKEIEENKKNLKEIEEKIKSIDLSVYEDSKNALNPSFNINKMIKTLKTDGCWATRQKHINGTKNNPIVNEQTISNIFDNHDKEIKLSLFNEKLKEYIFVKENATIVNANLLYPENVDLELIKDKLSYKVSKNSNDSLAEEIYKVINIHGESRVQEIHTTLSEDIKTCPYCFQSIDSNYKKEVLKRISDVLSKDGEELKTKLNNLKLNEFYQVEIPTIIEDSVKNELYVLVKKFNESIKKINEQIAQKIDNVYESYELQVGDYLVDKKNLVFLLDNIHDKIKSHNENVKKIKNLKTDLSLWNNYISWPMIEDEYQIYIGNEKRKKESYERSNELNDSKKILEDKIIKLKAQKNNIDLAVKEINRDLSFLFMSNNRLSLVPYDNAYRVLSKGKSVKLDDLSTGERNIISLCYFFATIGSGKELKKIYSDEYLIIVDDPITSFDNENKIGIYGYLRSKMKQIHLGNPSSRIILLTHDYEVAYNLDKINNDVFAELEIKSQPKGYRLVDFNISDLNIGKGSNQYAVMLRNVFMFANESDDNVGDYAIGNMIRRMLEMFSSFEYNTSFEKLNYRCDATELYELLNNYMFRIIANNESHSMIHAYAYDEVDRFEVFSHKEKVIAAKLSLILIKELNDKHIKAYLGDDYTIIEKWEEDYSDLIKEK